MSSHRVRFILAATFIAALAGCGQKGPLYLPVDETQPPAGQAPGAVADPAAAPAPAPAASDAAAAEESGASQGATE